MTLSEQHRQAAKSAANTLDNELGVRENNQRYADRATQGPLPDHPTLHLDDVSAIPFLLGISGVEEYQHRARTRASTGDLFAASTPAPEGYERYCREKLGMGEPTLISATPRKNKLAVADACAAGSAFDEICQAARGGGGLIIHPYMGIEDTWSLASKVREATGLPAQVLAPPPPTTWVANDKNHLSRLVEESVGSDYIVETQTQAEPAAIASALLDLSGRHSRVGLKRTRCASAMGNQVFRSDSITEESASQEVDAFLERTEWENGEPVLAVAWEETDHSPSTQLWIPPLGQGDPRLDGIYEQILSGEEKMFVGSRPSGLPEPVNRALGESGLVVAAALQELGYVGRCSFDYLVVGDIHGEFKVRFTECNGRWGGTSTPMSLVDRLVSGPRPPYRAQDFVSEKLVGVPFGEICERLGDSLFDPKTQRGQFILYNVGPLAESGKLDVIALAESQAQAESAMLNALPKLLGV